MELSEVFIQLNPQLMLPVVGVVIFVFLVFAFGVRSSVQPPSFDFDDTDKRSKRQKKSKKPTTNGHVVSVSNVEQVSKATTTPTKVSNPVAVKSHRNEDVLATKNKSKKLTAVKEVSKKEIKASVENDGEWTTQLSRKEKKQQRGKKEELLPTGGANIASEQLAEENQTISKEDVIKEHVVSESKMSPKEKRNKNKKVNKVPSAENKDMPNLESKPEVSPSVDAKQEISSSVEVETKTDQPPTPKMKKGNKKLGENTEVGDGENQDIVPVCEVSSVTKPAVATVSDVDNKQEEKKKQPSTSATTPATPVHPDTKIVQDELSDEKESSQTTIGGTCTTRDQDGKDDKVQPVDAQTDMSSHDQPVTFDEMPETWTEAKPQRKKKKARRDN